jgi:hypothetical protein
MTKFARDIAGEDGHAHVRECWGPAVTMCEGLQLPWDYKGIRTA